MGYGCYAEWPERQPNIWRRLLVSFDLADYSVQWFIRLVCWLIELTNYSNAFQLN